MGGSRKFVLGIGALAVLGLLALLLLLRPVDAQATAQAGGATRIWSRQLRRHHLPRPQRGRRPRRPPGRDHALAGPVDRRRRAQPGLCGAARPAQPSDRPAARHRRGEPAPMCLGCHATPPGPRGARPAERRHRLQILPRPSRAGCRAIMRSAAPRNVSRGLIPLENPAPAPRSASTAISAAPTGPVRHPPDHGRRPSAHLVRGRPVHHPPAASPGGCRLSQPQGRGGFGADVGGRPVDGARALAQPVRQPGARHRGHLPRILFLRLPQLPPPDQRQARFRASAVANPGRPIPSGMPPYNDGNDHARRRGASWRPSSRKGSSATAAPSIWR